MKLSFSPNDEIIVDLPKDRDIEINKIAIMPMMAGCEYSEKLAFHLDDKHDSDYFIGFYLNKNEAIYLRNYLDSFINEKKIDIDAED